MNLGDYLDQLEAKHRKLIVPQHQAGFRRNVVDHWFKNIAPVKAMEYGIECWERLGPKGLVADISACYYRWKNNPTPDALDNALVDGFGYAVILWICVEQSARREITPRLLPPDPSVSPPGLNEYIIKEAWEKKSPDSWPTVITAALTMSYLMYMEVRE